MENQNEIACSMYLSTIPNIKRQFTSSRSPLDVSDIKGSRARYIQNPRPVRDCSWRANTVEKSQPKQLIPEVVNKPSFILEVDDIQGTRTKINKFTTTRNTNPLHPQYQEPRVQYVPAPEPKFIRDNMAIDDIEGVRSRQTFANRLERAGKTINTKAAIAVNIKPTQKGFNRTRTSVNFNLQVQDINKGQVAYQDVPKRQTNPLQPKYDLPGQKSYGEIVGSKQIVKNNGLPLRQSNSLLTQDIDGAKPKVNNFICEKKDQVQGSKPESLKRGISSNRKTNPLQPNYNYPGWSQNGAVKYQNFTRPKTAVQRFDAFIK